jgi:PhnB protein
LDPYHLYTAIGEENNMQKSTQPIPEKYHTITPALVVRGAAEAIDFYKKAFHAAELGRADGPGGRIMHAEIKIGDSVVMLSDEFPEFGGCGSPVALKGSPVSLHIYVENADAFFAGAVAAGAQVTMPLMDAFWGDRYGKLRDPFGHEWSGATHQFDYTKEEMERGFQEMMARMKP